eukprot:3521520-Prymnesium_polylepis.1
MISVSDVATSQLAQADRKSPPRRPQSAGNSPTRRPQLTGARTLCLPSSAPALSPSRAKPPERDTWEERRLQLEALVPPRKERERLMFRDDQKLNIMVEHCSAARPRRNVGLRGSNEKYTLAFKVLVDAIFATISPEQQGCIEAHNNMPLNLWPKVDKSVMALWRRTHLGHFDRLDESRRSAQHPSGSLLNGYKLTTSRAAKVAPLMEAPPWVKPRIGAFEVVYSLMHGVQCIGSGLLCSKLRTKKWPQLIRAVQRLDDEVQDYLWLIKLEVAEKISNNSALKKASAAASKAEAEATEAEAARAKVEELEEQLAALRLEGKDCSAVEKQLKKVRARTPAGPSWEASCT